MVSNIVYVVSFVIYHLLVLCIYTKGEIIFDIFEAFKYLNILWRFVHSVMRGAVPIKNMERFSDENGFN